MSSSEINIDYTIFKGFSLAFDWGLVIAYYDGIFAHFSLLLLLAD